MTLDQRKNLVFAPYLKNEWTELNHILYTHYYTYNYYIHNIGIVSVIFLQICNKCTTLVCRQNLAQPWTAELAALDQLKKSFNYFRTI